MSETAVIEKRIVVGVDGSPASRDALVWALRQAGLTGARVEAVTSWHYPQPYGPEYYPQQLEWGEIASSTLANAVAELGPDAEQVEQRVLEGHPAHVLVEASKGAELLVVGSRGHGGFVGMLLGSVSEHVIAHASCPVLVIRHPEQGVRAASH